MLRLRIFVVVMLGNPARMMCGISVGEKLFWVGFIITGVVVKCCCNRLDSSFVIMMRGNHTRMMLGISAGEYLFRVGFTFIV